jgi:hypothetical protein
VLSVIAYFPLSLDTFSDVANRMVRKRIQVEGSVASSLRNGEVGPCYKTLDLWKMYGAMSDSFNNLCVLLNNF